MTDTPEKILFWINDDGEWAWVDWDVTWDGPCFDLKKPLSPQNKGGVEYTRSDLVLRWNTNMEEAPRDGVKVDLMFDGRRHTDCWFEGLSQGNGSWLQKDPHLGEHVITIESMTGEPDAWMPIPEFKGEQS